MPNNLKYKNAVINICPSRGAWNTNNLGPYSLNRCQFNETLTVEFEFCRCMRVKSR